jgi:hypothetical protein
MTRPDGTLHRRVRDRLRLWQITPERAIETKGSIVVLGRRGEQPVAVKVMPNSHDEWFSGQVLNVTQVHADTGDRVSWPQLLEQQRSVSLVKQSSDAISAERRSNNPDPE